MLGQVNPQLVASSQSIVASQTGITVVAGVPGNGTKSPIVNVAVTKPPMIPRAQAQIRPTAAVNIVNNSATANGASLIQQQQLRIVLRLHTVQISIFQRRAKVRLARSYNC